MRLMVVLVCIHKVVALLVNQVLVLITVSCSYTHAN